MPIKLTLPLFNVARRPRPAPHFRRTMSKPVAPGCLPRCPCRAGAAVGRGWPHLFKDRARCRAPAAPRRCGTFILSCHARLSSAASRPFATCDLHPSVDAPGKMRLFPWRICDECNLRAALVVLFTRDRRFSWYNATDPREACFRRDNRVYESRT